MTNKTTTALEVHRHWQPVECDGHLYLVAFESTPRERRIVRKVFMPLRDRLEGPLRQWPDALRSLLLNESAARDYHRLCFEVFGDDGELRPIRVEEASDEALEDGIATLERRRGAIDVDIRGLREHLARRRRRTDAFGASTP
jgi:hypothetical protein